MWQIIYETAIVKCLPVYFSLPCLKKTLFYEMTWRLVTSGCLPMGSKCLHQVVWITCEIFFRGEGREAEKRLRFAMSLRKQVAKTTHCLSKPYRKSHRKKEIWQKISDRPGRIPTNTFFIALSENIDSKNASLCHRLCSWKVNARGYEALEKGSRMLTSQTL